MKAYRYETRISETGQIKLHLNSQLFDKEVEIIILPKQETTSSELKVSDFLDQWFGLLSKGNTDELKYQYLNDKYK
jgi:hypothetical protein